MLRSMSVVLLWTLALPAQAFLLPDGVGGIRVAQSKEAFYESASRLGFARDAIPCRDVRGTEFCTLSSGAARLTYGGLPIREVVISFDSGRAGTVEVFFEPSGDANVTLDRLRTLITQKLSAPQRVFTRGSAEWKDSDSVLFIGTTSAGVTLTYLWIAQGAKAA